MDRVSNHTGFGLIIAIFILIVFVISPSLFEKFHFHYIHESGMCMLIGLIFSALDFYLRPDKDIASELKFDEHIFFNLILPPIIFAAGYNLKRKGFYKYFLYILSFGLLGTIINFLLVAPLTWLANHYNLFYVSHVGHNLQYMVDENPNIYNQTLNFSIKEILLFSAMITATDTVAALTFVNEESDPKLFAILFGEGVINDAVAIVLYKVVFKKLSEKEGEGNFIYK